MHRDGNTPMRNAIRSVTVPATGLALGLLLAAAAAATDQVYPEDCFNDNTPQRNDLEPPPPGSAPDLMRIPDQDVRRVLDEIAAAERKRIAARSPRAAGTSGPRTD